jgi:hypothetical protein
MPGHIVLKNVVQTVPVEKQTAAYRLFHIYRRVMVPQVFTMNQNTLQEVGMPTSGNEKVDRYLRTEWVTVKMTPVEMTTYLQRGASILFENDADATQVYLDLVEHLRDWLQAFYDNPNLRKAPIRDLQLFDDLAREVFKYANHRLMKNEEDTAYGQWLAGGVRTMGFDVALGIFSSKEEQKPVIASYTSLSDQIAEKLAQRLERKR